MEPNIEKTDSNKCQLIIKFSNNKCFSDKSSILPRIKFRVGGQGRSPQSLQVLNSTVIAYDE